jgi:5,5'-dehydrodivanillate O-demethylase
MLTTEQNLELTQVGAGTPGGELLRRYWHPIAVTKELTAESPIKRLRVMGEDLVLFRDEDGEFGLIAELCAHRGASLYYAFLEEGCIRCPYHGWMYNKSGDLVEAPFEPETTPLKKTVHMTSYPVINIWGLLFTYMGPVPAPVLPPWDVIVRREGHHLVEVHPILDANWLQVQETNVDPTHNTFLHGKWGHRVGLRKNWEFRAVDLDFTLTEWGIVKQRTFGGDAGSQEEGHPALFPNALRHASGHGPIDIYWRTPVDDTHTQSFNLAFHPNDDGSFVEEPADAPVEYVVLKNEAGDFHMANFPSQDSMAWETQGALRDRSLEHLGVGDKGVAMLRRLLKEQIEIVKDGGDPMGVIRDPSKYSIIDFGTAK